MSGSPPPHHTPDGGFRIPWPVEGGEERGAGSFWRWQWERLTQGTPPNPPADAFPLVESRVARPRAPAGEVRATWVGHATFLLQVGGVNVLTDPIWSERASPLQWLGPARLAPPGLPFDALPPVDAVLISHDHYDHLDAGTVERLHERYGAALRWVTPLGYAEWMAERGIENLTELDWWEETTVRAADREVTVTCAPAQHWTRRGVLEHNDRLWGSFALRGAGGERVYFGADSGYFPGYEEIGERLGPFDAVLLPIGAYAPRWFMRPAHMNPEEAVRAYRDLGGEGAFVPMHWGTFRLTDENPLEPPVRVRGAWDAEGLPPGELHVLRHGETLVVGADTDTDTR